MRKTVVVVVVVVAAAVTAVVMGEATEVVMAEATEKGAEATAIPVVETECDKPIKAALAAFIILKKIKLY